MKNRDSKNIGAAFKILDTLLKIYAAPFAAYVESRFSDILRQLIVKHEDDVLNLTKTCLTYRTPTAR